MNPRFLFLPRNVPRRALRFAQRSVDFLTEGRTSSDKSRSFYTISSHGRVLNKTCLLYSSFLIDYLIFFICLPGNFFFFFLPT